MVCLLCLVSGHLLGLWLPIVCWLHLEGSVGGVYVHVHCRLICSANHVWPVVTFMPIGDVCEHYTRWYTFNSLAGENRLFSKPPNLLPLNCLVHTGGYRPLLLNSNFFFSWESTSSFVDHVCIVLHVCGYQHVMQCLHVHNFANLCALFTTLDVAFAHCVTCFAVQLSHTACWDLGDAYTTTCCACGWQNVRLLSGELCTFLSGGYGNLNCTHFLNDCMPTCCQHCKWIVFVA